MRIKCTLKFALHVDCKCTFKARICPALKAHLMRIMAAVNRSIGGTTMVMNYYILERSLSSCKTFKDCRSRKKWDRYLLIIFIKYLISKYKKTLLTNFIIYLWKKLSLVKCLSAINKNKWDLFYLSQSQIFNQNS